jgi:hypothetical protein
MMIKLPNKNLRVKTLAIETKSMYNGIVPKA